MKRESLFTGNTKVSDIVDIQPHLLGVFPRIGMPLGFGDASVSEACSRAGVDENTFLLICNLYAFPDKRPDPAGFASIDPGSVAAYLRRSHRFYLDEMMVSLFGAVEKMLENCEPRRRRIILEFFTDYRTDLENHFLFEEEHVFPYLKELFPGGNGGAQRAGIVDEHEHIEQQIGDLIHLVMKYLPAECKNSDTLQVLSLLFFLQQDLDRHTLFEDAMLGLSTRDGKRPKAGDRPTEQLSDREKEILVCVAQGLQNKEIADKFNLSIYTVTTHRKNITRKTGIKSIAGLTVYAILDGLIDIESVS